MKTTKEHTSQDSRALTIKGLTQLIKLVQDKYSDYPTMSFVEKKILALVGSMERILEREEEDRQRALKKEQDIKQSWSNYNHLEALLQWLDTDDPKVSDDEKIKLRVLRDIVNELEAKW